MEVTDPFQSFLDIIISLILQVLSAQYQTFFALFEILESFGAIV